MEKDLIKTKLYDGLTQAQEELVIQRWDALRKSHRLMFYCVAAAAKRREGLANAGNMPFEDWASHYDIADEYGAKSVRNGKPILIPSRIKLLNRLVDDGLVITARRKNRHIDENGRWMPHNSSRVYKPAPGVLDTLEYESQAAIRARMKRDAEKRPRKKRIEQPSLAMLPVNAASAERPAPRPAEYRPIPDPPTPLTTKLKWLVTDIGYGIWKFLGRIDPFQR